MCFLALSHAPPALAMNKASMTPVRVAPANRPPSVSTPSTLPASTGAATAVTPGRIISRSAARVEMSTHRALSGFAVPSMRPAISRNCRRTSWTMPSAARPTAVIVEAAMKNGRMPPRKSPITTFGLATFRVIGSAPGGVTALVYALKSARAVSAAEPMAKPLPMAAVVLPSASRPSVILRTSGPRPLISLIPPALSAIGP